MPEAQGMRGKQSSCRICYFYLNCQLLIIGMADAALGRLLEQLNHVQNLVTFSRCWSTFAQLCSRLS